MTTTTANTSAAPIAMIFAFSDSLVLQALKGLEQQIPLPVVIGKMFVHD
jgi:hypothetical protein